MNHFNQRDRGGNHVIGRTTSYAVVKVSATV